MSEEKRPVLNEQEAQMGMEFLNTIYQAAIVSLPIGLVPAAKEAQMKGLQEAGQGLVDLIQAHGPKSLAGAAEIVKADNRDE
jgi:hypothetical protein